LNVPQHPEETRRWIRYAREDLKAAVAMQDGGLGVPRQACWLAQQAAEKALKAALVVRQVEFPRTHDLDLLFGMVPPESMVRTASLDLAELSEWAVEARYPGDWPDATPEDARQAVLVAEQVVALVEGDLAKVGLAPDAHDSGHEESRD
jgi:HEPN domain-containing protein